MARVRVGYARSGRARCGGRTVSFERLRHSRGARRAVVDRRLLGSSQPRRARQVAGGVRRRVGAAVRGFIRRSADAREHRAHARAEPVLSAEREGLAGRRAVDQQHHAARAQAVRRATVPRDGDGRHAPAGACDGAAAECPRACDAGGRDGVRCRHARTACQARARRPAFRPRALACAISRAAAGDRRFVDRASVAACGAATVAGRGDRHGFDRQRVSRGAADGSGLSTEMIRTTMKRGAGAAKVSDGEPKDA